MSDSDMSSSDPSSGEEEEEETEEVTERPRTIYTDSDLVDICFHPSNEYLLGSGDMDGYIRMFKCEPGIDSLEKSKMRLTKKPIRCLSFSYKGEDLFCLTKDKSMVIIDTESGKVKHRNREAHSSSPYCLAVIDSNLISSGDEDGVTKIWDLRKGDTAVMEAKKFEDYVSDLAVDDKHRLLFATSGDGTMATFNARQRKFVVQAEQQESDISCAQVMKKNNKLIVGQSEGPMLLYNWDEFGAPSDHFPHPGSIECIAKVTDDVICTASSDGFIRAVNILPNRILGIVGDHKDLPVDKVRATWDGKFIASSSHTSVVRFWSVEHLKDIEIDAREKPKKSEKNKKMKQSGVGGEKVDFFSDLDKEFEVPEANSSSEDESSEEENDEENAGENAADLKNDDESFSENQSEGKS